MNQKSIEKIESIWREVFTENVHTETLDNGGIGVNGYIITPMKIEVERVSLKGRETKTVDGWELSVFENVPDTYFEPEDCVEVHIAESPQFDKLIVSMFKYEVSRRVTQILYTKGYAESFS